MSGVKFDQDKVDMTILPASFLVGTARAMSYGAGKYDRWNFLKVEGAGRRYSGALLRHIVAWMAGEDRDPESGLHHLECASANLAMLISSEAHGVDIGEWREPVAVTAQETSENPRLNTPTQSDRFLQPEGDGGPGFVDRLRRHAGYLGGF